MPSKCSSDKKAQAPLSAGSIVWWSGWDGKEHGPSTVLGVLEIEGNTWFWFNDDDGGEYLMKATEITAIQAFGSVVKSEHKT